MKIKLSKWAKQNDISYNTAYSWFKNNKMPCHCEQTETGTIICDTVFLRNLKMICYQAILKFI